MAKYRVAINFEEGVSIEVDADNKQDAEQKAYTLVENYGGTDYPKKYNQDTLHSDYFTQDAKLIGEKWWINTEHI